ncbi:MAG: rhodanese-like domain-containing protein [Deltaproteobacteria bacterium]|nr:MAG: rhodanese-like domain-containing protein [Deltaproteobacteria bacterium]
MPTLPSRSPVTEVPALRSADALQHFSRLLEVETDCWDVHASLESGGFVLLDVRSPEHFRRGHVRGAVNLPHARISARALEQHPPGTLFVVYCDGPHCNGADRAAIRLASLDRPVKKMIGGVTGWIDEGFPLVEGP